MGLGDFFSGITESMGQGFWPAIIQTGAMLTAGLLGNNDEFHPYAQTQEGFDAQMALEREQMAQALEIAKMNAAASKSGSGAAVAAARIAQESAMKQGVMKQIADNLAYKMDAKKSGMVALQRARENMLAAKQRQTELMSALYQGAGSSLGTYRR